MNGKSSDAKQKRFNGGLLLLLLVLGGTLAVLCRKGLLPYQVFWANDITLGAAMESSVRLPASIFACWADYWWLGGPSVAYPPNLSNFSMALLTPEIFLKFYAPMSMLFLGFAAWFLFRQLRFAPRVCVLGGLAAGLNMHFFSNACWGLPQWNVCAGMIFVALGIMVSSNVRPLWLKGVLAGLSTGLAVMEGFDVGAILSIYVGIFLAFMFLTDELEEPPARAGKTLLVGGLVVLSAILISLSTIYILVELQIKGIGNGGMSQSDKAARWGFTAQWSIPKLESVRVIIPGVFGYRMQEFTTSTNKAGSYWGKIAEDPHIQDLESSDPQVRTNAAASLGIPAQLQGIFASDNMKAREELLDQIKPQLQRRHTGNGEYAGVLVCLLAVFGLVNAARNATSVYSAQERRVVWFWGGAALFSLLAAWGRFGFVYRFIYALPFLTNIRSPMKFMHPLNISLIILAGYGLEALYRRSLSQPAERSGSLVRWWLNWWHTATGFETKWVIGSGIALIVAVAGFFIVQSSKPDLMHYLEHNGFDSDLAGQIAGFCIGEVGFFVLFLALSALVLIFILSGSLTGRLAICAWVLLGAVMICDLYRANVPWIRYYNYKEKLSPNSVVDLLRQTPWEHRVVSRFSPIGAYDLGGADPNFGGLCHWWLENDYPYNDIESLEIDQAPRLPTIDSSYLGNFTLHSANDLSPAAIQWATAHQGDKPPNPFMYSVTQSGPAVRLWRLTNTRYIFADANLVPILNQFTLPTNSFRTVLRMDLIQKPGVTQVEDAGDLTIKTNSQGPLALIEFTRALPRTKLFANWQVVDDPVALQTLASSQFDPEKTVLVAKDTPLPQAPGQPDIDPGTVAITRYHSRDLLLQADAKTPAVLLLNDHTGDNWNVWIDQKPGTVLRCNYIMQGVFIPPGRHTIEFRFQPPQKVLYTSLTAFVVGILLGGYVIVTHFVRGPMAPAPTAGLESQTQRQIA
jgi:hypothetical protein